MPRPASTSVAAELPPHRRGTLNRERILHAASELFHEKGYDGATLVDVAKALSVTKPTLYYHFQSKEEILLGCVIEACDRLDSALVLADREKRSGRQRLAVFLRAYAEVISDNFGISLVLSDPRVMSEDGRQEYLRRRKKISNYVSSIIKQGVQDGTLRSDNTMLTSYAIFGMFNWIARWRHERPGVTVQEIVDQFNAVLFDGIATGQPSSSRVSEPGGSFEAKKPSPTAPRTQDQGRKRPPSRAR